MELLLESFLQKPKFRLIFNTFKNLSKLYCVTWSHHNHRKDFLALNKINVFVSTFTMCNLSNSCKTIEKRCAFFSFEQAMTDKTRNRSQFLEHLACRFKWNVSYYHWIFQHSECCNTLSCGCLTPLNTRYILQGETTCIYIFHGSVVFSWSVGLWLVFFC